MEEQSYPHRSGFGKEQQNGIQRDGNVGMKRMKSYAATMRIKNGCCQ